MLEQVLYGDQCILNIVLREKAKYYSLQRMLSEVYRKY